MAKILIVEDSKIMRVELKGLLESKKYNIIEAEDGNSGLEAIKTHPDVGLIICDINMPGMDGLTMISQIRQMKAHKKLPVFVLTTESNPQKKKLGREAGVTAWIIKPLQEEALLNAISQVLS